MKRLSVLISVWCMLAAVFTVAQPTLQLSADFENGIPTGWTTSSDKVSIEESDVVISGTKCVKINHNTTVSKSEYLQTPVITVPANRQVRLEFNHIAMVPSDATAQIKLIVNGEEKAILTGANCYDKNNGGLNVFQGSFSKGSEYWRNLPDEKTVKPAYWRHEVFYLSSKLDNATSFQIQFALPKGSTKTCYGWLIDDVKIYVASADGNEVGVPIIKEIYAQPDMKEYPYCSDAEVSYMCADIGSGLSKTADSLYLMYYTPGDTTIKTVNLELTKTFGDTGYVYSAHIPYAGVDSTVFWKAVINDALGNKVTYPYTGVFSEFKYVRPYIGSDPIKQESSQSYQLLFPSSMMLAMHQIRYSAKELRDAGYTPGKIGGMYVNVKQSSGSVLKNYKLYIGMMDTDEKFASQYSVFSGTLYNVLNQAEFVVPPVGWQYIEFDEDVDCMWDGESDIILKMCFNGTTTAGETKVESYSVSDDQYKTRRMEATSGTSTTACSGSLNVDAPFIDRKPNIRFKFVDICHFNTDAGIRTDTILSPVNAVNCDGRLRQMAVCQAGTPATLKVMLRNDGVDDLTKVKVKWMLDDNISTLDSSIWTGLMRGLDSNMKAVDTATIYTATTSFLPPAGVHELKIWTEMPDNTLIDWNYDNDTAEFKIIVTEGEMNGFYAIGGNISGIPATKTYKTFEDAFLMMINSGIGGACTFKIYSQSDTLYKGSWVFPSCLTGLSATNTLTFVNDSQNDVVFTESDSNPFIFDLSGIKYFTFKNLKFSSIESVSKYSHSAFDMVRLSSSSSDITFDSCAFINYGRGDKYYERVNRLINIGSAKNVKIDKCVFDAPAKYQVYFEGVSPTSLAENMSVTNSSFSIVRDEKPEYVENAVYARYAKDVTISKNTFTSTMQPSSYESLTSTGYVILMNTAESANINKNTFTIYGSSVLSFASVNNSVVANNNISIKNENTTNGAYNCYGLNMTSGQNNKIVYNNIYGSSINKSNKRVYGLNMGYTGSVVTNNIIKNNIIVSDGYGYAVAIRPSSDNSFDFSNNVYYKTSIIPNLYLFSYNGDLSTTLDTWKEQTNDDSSYYTDDPIFLAWNNLYTTNIILCEGGTHIDGVTDDYNGDDRPAKTEKNPCIGSREFNPPPSNIYVIKTGITSGTFDGKNSYSDCHFENETVFVEFRNISADTIPANTLQLNYSVDGTTSSPYTFTDEVLPDSLYHVEFTNKYNFTSVNGTQIFELKAYSILDKDSVKNNDTAFAEVVSLYQLPALEAVNKKVDYNTSALVDVSELVPNDSVYWFYHLDDSVYFYKGHSFETDNLYSDTTMYFSRKEEIAVVKISEIQYSNNTSKDGLTPNLPGYVNVANAYEISNFGNGDIDMSKYKFLYYKAKGDSLVSSAAAYTFPDNYVLKANSSVVLVPTASVSVAQDEAIAINTNNFKATATAKVGFAITNAQDEFVDAVAVNGTRFAIALKIPESIWKNTDKSIDVTSETAGIIRNDANSNTSDGWTVASGSNPMSIGTYNENLTVYSDNGCFGFFTPYNIEIINIPEYDPGIAYVELTDVSDTAGCGLATSEIKVKITNTGLKDLETVIPIVCEIYDDGEKIQTITESYSELLAKSESAEYVLSQKVDLSASERDRHIVVKVYTSLEADIIHTNDTAYASVTSLQTPSAPVAQDILIPYASTGTVTAESDHIVVWYSDYDSDSELARGNSYTTPVLYEAETLYTEAFLQIPWSQAMGTDSSLVGKSSSNGYPSPFNTIYTNVKEQYLVRADSLLAYGYDEGQINGVLFNISSVELKKNQLAVNWNNYSVKIGMTDNDVLNDWETDLTEVYNTAELSFDENVKGWKELTFDNPFSWDGVSNIIVEICFTAENNDAKVYTYNTTTSYMCARSRRDNKTEVCSWVSDATASYNNKMPYMKFNMSLSGCRSERVPVVVNVAEPPSCDAAMVKIVSPEEDNITSGIDIPVSVEIKNYGTNNLQKATIKWKVNSQEQEDVVWTGDIAQNETVVIELGDYKFSSGAVCIEAQVVADCEDTITANDTVSRYLSACLGTDSEVTYFEIGEDKEYSSIGKAVEALQISGICGPVVFNIADGTYDEQINIGLINGASKQNTILFTTSGDVTLKSSESSEASDNQNILNISGSSYITFENIVFEGDNNSGDVLLENTTNIAFKNVVFTMNSDNKQVVNLVTLSGKNDNITFDQDEFINGSYSLVTILSKDNVSVSNGLNISACKFTDFIIDAVRVSDFDNVKLSKNYFRSHTTTQAGEAVSLSNISGQSHILANRIILTETTKNRGGIVVRSSDFSDLSPLNIVNNEIAIIGTGSNASLGIDVDSSNYVQIYYNTVLLKVTDSKSKSKNIAVGKASNNIYVRNNNLDNQSKGYAYYVEAANSPVALSDNNNYITNSTLFAYWTTNISDLTALKAANSFDASSVSETNPFKSDTCLMLRYPTDIVRQAEPLEEFVTDINDSIRPATPKPTIGAYEYQFEEYDAGVVELLSPQSKTKYIEYDPVTITAVIKNFGNFTINTMDVVAVLKRNKDSVSCIDSIRETYTGFIASLDTIHYTFNKYFTAQLNVPDKDSLYIEVYVDLKNDTINYNDTSSVKIKVNVGKDLSCTATRKQDAGQSKCGQQMTAQEIAAVIRNVGSVTVGSGDVITVSYEVRGQDGQLLTQATEQLSFPYTYTNDVGVSQTIQDLQPDGVIQYFIFKNNKPNLMPLNGRDTSWSIRTSVRLVGDNRYGNDTSSAVTYEVLAPAIKPEGHNDTVNYATWARPQASQVDSLVIKWYKDSTDIAPFLGATGTYKNSTAYDIGPMYRDTTFYLRVDRKGNVSCPSYFDSVRVIIRPRCATDLAAVAVVEPPASDTSTYIFMEADTVKVAITNYGSETKSNFKVVCEITCLSEDDPVPVLTEEICDMSVAPNDTIVYPFKTMFNFAEEECKSYQVRAWTADPNDCSPQNDTCDYIKTKGLDGVKEDGHGISNSVSLDITQVQFATLNNKSGNGSDAYSDFTKTLEPTTLFRGLEDSLIVTVEPAADMTITENTVIEGYLKAWIDWNRDGVFDSSECIYSDTVILGQPNSGLVTIPEDAHTGYTLMRIIVSQNDSQHTFWATPGNGQTPSIDGGEIEDYKIFVSPIENTNAELIRFESPARMTFEQHQQVTVRIRNSGKSVMEKADITWIYNGDTNVYNWEGALTSSQTADVVLLDGELNFGLNEFKAYIDLEGDEYHNNDTVTLTNFTFHTYTVPFLTDFDEQETIETETEEGEITQKTVNSNVDFHAYEADLSAPSNCWQFGKPGDAHNKIIKSAYSKPNCWKTNIDGQYPENNTSVLYSPVYDINKVKPDTVSFMLRKDMAAKAYMYVEYTNYTGTWVKLGSKKDPNGDNWYDSDEGFSKTNATWERVAYSLDGISGNLGSSIQFRFVFVSGEGRVGDGVAIDEFSIGRARRDSDAGVTKIELTPEKLPNYGQYFYPKVTVRNYGKKELTTFKVCYVAEDMHIPQCEDVFDRTVPVNDTIEYTFHSGRYLSASMPDPFTIMAYTRLNPEDLYTDNDTAWATCVIGPLMTDAAILAIEEPTAKVASNDDISVAIRVKNYGLTPIEKLPVYYSVANNTQVSEVITFNPPLNNSDEYVYQFKQTYRSSFGRFNLKAWIGLEGDNYHDNDTLYKRLEGTNTTVDVEAKAITLDETDPNTLGVQIAMYNRSNVGVDNITVGYYYNGDPTTTVEELYREGTTLRSNSYGYHMFSRRIPRQMYQSVCAYIIVKNDENPDNDTTCSVYIAYRDAQADSIMVEHNVNKTSTVQLRAHNVGNIGGKTTVRAAYVYNGNWANPVRQTFEWTHDEPNGMTEYMNFDQGVPRSEDGKYDIVAWIEYPNDENRSNDTTNIVIVTSYIGLDSIVEGNISDFELEQNVPNPLKNTTAIGITLPEAGEVTFYVTSAEGRIVFTNSWHFTQGHHTINFDASDLPQGVYYYITEFNGKKKSKKMVVIK